MKCMFYIKIPFEGYIVPYTFLPGCLLIINMLEATSEFKFGNAGLS